MNPIVINGTVLCDPITGIPRFVYEVVTRLDPLLEGTGLDVRLCYRDDGRPLHLPELKNIKIVPLKAIKYSYNLVVLPRYLRKHHAFYVGLASDMLMTRRSVVVLHDIRPLVMKTDRAFFLFKFWFQCLSTKWFARRVFTVSDNKRIITHWEAWPGTKTLSGCVRLPPATRIKPLLWPAARTLLPLAAPKQMLPKTPAISFTPAM